MGDEIFCPVANTTGVCRQTVKPLPGDRPTYIICGFYSEVAGRCSVGLLVDGLRVINEKADRLASAAEAIYAVLDPIDMVEEALLEKARERREKREGKKK